MTEQRARRPAARFSAPPPGAPRVRSGSAGEHLEAMRAIHAGAVPARPGMLTRPGPWWEERLYDPESDREGSHPLRAVVADDAYALYAVRRKWDDDGPAGEVHVREIVANGQEGHAAVWAYLLDLDLTRTVVWEPAPADEPLWLMLQDPRAVRRALWDALGVRLVDVPAALAARRYASDPDVVLEIRDAFCPWNEGRYRLGPDACAPTGDEPDLVLDASTLAAAYLGGTTLAQLAAARRVEERTPGGLARHPVHELPVDLELVELEAAQMAQRRLPLAEVVERQPDAERAQPPQDRERALRIGRDQVLGDLERQPLRRAATPLQRAADLLGEVEVEQVRRPQVDGHPELRPERRHLFQRAVEDEGGQRAREPALFGERQEMSRREQPARRVLPAHERLHAPDRPPGQRRLRLVVQHELPRVDRAAQLADEREPVAAVVVARGQVDLVAGPHPLGLVHGDVGALQEPDRIPGVLREQRDADARVDVHGDVLDAEGVLERSAQPQPGGARGRLVPGRQHERELVPAEPRERVVLAHRAAQPRPDLAQHLVARVMAQGVVELLEPVEVDEQQGQLVAPLDRGLQPLDQVAPIREPGEVVGQRARVGLAQPLRHREARSRHAGEHGDQREHPGDVAQDGELPDGQQRQRGGGEGDDRGEHGPAELRAGPEPLLVPPGRHGEERRRGGGRVLARAEGDDPEHDERDGG